MKHQPLIVVGALLVGAALPALAQTKPAANAAAMVASSPGQATVSGLVSVSAKVEAIDAATRQLTLKGRLAISIP